MLHFSTEEFAHRQARFRAAMAEAGVDYALLFAPETHYWLTGYDTFGFCFFQCMIVTPHDIHLLTRSADLRQAQLTSVVSDIRVWPDGTNPEESLAEMLTDLGVTGRVGAEVDTHGLTARNYQRLLRVQPDLVDISSLAPTLRLTKSTTEIAYIRRAAELCDAAFEAATPLLVPGASEADILAAMQGAVLAGGGDYPGNPFIVGSGEHALLCRYATGRGTLSETDQITLEWAGVYRQYHVAAMRTVVIGEPTPKQQEMFEVATEALAACEAALKPGTPMREVYAAHAEVFDAAGYGDHRLNACGYALGARYAPSWMEPQMFHAGAETVIAPNQVYFLHMILMDSENGFAMCPGRTSLVTEAGAEPLSRLPLSIGP